MSLSWPESEYHHVTTSDDDYDAPDDKVRVLTKYHAMKINTIVN
jgi:hypothetical protein